MSVGNRLERSVRRGVEIDGLWAKRNRKAEKRYDRWFSGCLIEKDIHGNLRWLWTPKGRNLVHKGRKP